MTKKITQYSLLFILLSLITAVIYAQGSFSQTLTPAVTTLAANSTNTTAGTIFELYQGQSPVRIYMTASGIAATTNGSLVVKFSTATGGGAGVTNNFDTANASNVKLTMTTLAGSTNTVSDWFQLKGVKYIRVGQIENQFTGAISNLTIVIGYDSRQ